MPDKAAALIENGQGKQDIDQLRKLWEILTDYGEQEKIKFDLTLVSHMCYYTGIVFEVYVSGVGFPIGNGGRYDLLLKKFGKNSGATGFALRLDRLAEATGILDKKDPVTCILFSGERRKEAIGLAKEKRGAGERVVLQDINGVKNIDLYSEQFTDVIFLIGKAGKEAGE